MEQKSAFYSPDNVAEEQVYSVPAGDAQLPQGIYVYMISNGKQKYTGRIIKQR